MLIVHVNKREAALPAIRFDVFLLWVTWLVSTETIVQVSIANSKPVLAGGVSRQCVDNAISVQWETFV